MDAGSSSSHSRWGSSGSLSGQSNISTSSNTSHMNHYKLRLPSNSVDNSYSSHYDSEGYGDLSRGSRSPKSTSPTLYSQERGTYVYDQQLRYPPPSIHPAGLSTTENSTHVQEIHRLRTENVMLKAQNEILQSNFNALLSSLSNTTTAQPAALSPLVTLNEADYPRAKHWQKKSWTKQIQHDAGRTSKTNRATKNCLLFITNQEGEPPTQDVLEDIRKLSYSVFFGCEREGILPAVWSQAGHDVLNRFRSTLEAAFPDLRLCHRHWKADRLAGKVFMAWCGTHRKKVKVENNSDDDSDDGNSDADNGDETDSGEVVVHAQKRSASVLSHGAEPRPKRAKPDSASSSERPLERTQDKGKRRTKNPLFNKTPATITTTGTLVVSASSSSAIAPTLPPPTSPSALVPPASAVPSPSTSTLNPLAPPSPFTSIANPLAAPSALSVIMPTPPVPATNPVASPQLTQPVAAPIPAQTSTTLNLEPAPQPKAWKPAANSTTGKGQAAFAFKTDHPNADKDEFEHHYKNLSTAAKEVFKEKASTTKGVKEADKAAKAIAKAAKTQAAQGR